MSELEPGVLDLLPLAVLPASGWPELAQRWLHEGHRSQSLVDFAALSPAEAQLLADSMLDVLRSLGVNVGTATSVGGSLFEVSGLASRCRRAVEPVAADLQRTWKPIPLQVMSFDHEPPLFVQVVIGKDLSSSSGAMTASMADDERVADAATQVSEAFMEVAGYQWPFCAVHGRRMVVRDAEPDSPGRRPRWVCSGPDGHAVAEVGHLRSSDAGCHETWWARAKEFNFTDGV